MWCLRAPRPEDADGLSRWYPAPDHGRVPYGRGTDAVQMR